MHHTKVTKRTIASTIAVLAMVMSLFAQSLPLLQNATGNTSLVICTTYGLQTISIDENGQETPQQEQKPKHCSLCLIAGMEHQPSPTVIALHTSEITYPTAIQKQAYRLTAKTIERKALPIRAPPTLS